jgi:hypothetical protein
MATIDMDKAAGQIKAAWQMNIPPKLAIPMRVIASVVAIRVSWMPMCRSARSPTTWSPGFSDPDA